MEEGFLVNRGDYHNLISYRKTECIYDITFYFANTYLNKGDRTIDQMIQAARSGKQNIAEGSAAAVTSSETELKLTNVARASLKELLEDYKDFLRVRELEIWAPDSAKVQQTRKVCKEHTDSAYYLEAIKIRSAETIANIAIILLYQADVLLRKLIESMERRFIATGGIREQMTQARLEYRKRSKGY